MQVELVPDHIGNEPLILDASLVIVRNEQGVPIMVAGAYGPNGAIRASHAMDDDFNETLHKLGINRTVICDRIELPPPPPGARLIRDPRHPQTRKAWPDG